MKRYAKKCLCLLLALIVMFSMSGCLMMYLQEKLYEYKEEKYYKNVDNFITEEAIIKSIAYYEEYKCIYLCLDEIDEDYSENDFIIEGKNLKMVLERGILEKLKAGDEITFTSAPRYFGDGYEMPIVAITFNGEELLGFEEGHKNLMDMY